MDKDSYKTKVIFRKFKEGDIIAIFPEEPGTNNPYDCMSYQHIGQHGVCDPGIIQYTSIVSPDEYKALFDELTSIGYNLQVCKRYTSAMREARYNELAYWNEQADKQYAEQESNYLHSIGG